MVLCQEPRGSALPFTGRASKYCVEWGFVAEARFKKVGYMLEKIAVLKGQGLSSEILIYTFMQRWLQPLMVHQNPMWKFASESDPDRHSTEALSKSEVEARVNDVTDGVMSDFMKEGGPPSQLGESE